ncbi:MAG: FlgD immunoglobulin-like domain containing protein [bacterium]
MKAKVAFSAVLCAGVCFLISTSASVLAQPQAKIKPLGIAPSDEIYDPDSVQIYTSALRNVGTGTYVFLLGIAQADTTVDAWDWTLISRPGGSAATLDSTGTEVQSLVPDEDGHYLITLVVTAGGQQSDPDTIDVNASTWIGIGNLCGATATYPQCSFGNCHSSQNSSWPGTGHAAIFQEGIDGIASSHYASYCIKCHTVGYDTRASAVNHGFDDVADTLGWVFPDTLEEGNFDSLCANYPELAQLSNIQCENCHGPGADHGGVNAAIDYTYNIGACAACHDAPTHHMLVTEWKNSDHARSADMSFVVNNSSCLKCMSTNGFVEVQVKGNPEQVYDFPEPVNCIACHNPHEAINSHQVRFSGVIDVQGQQYDAGLGAVCAYCHTMGDAQPGESVHHPQIEMLAGVGAYEYPGQIYDNGAHTAAVQDRCVGCHMSETPADSLPGAHWIGGHAWQMVYADTMDTVHNVSGCTPCHGVLPDFDVGGTQTLLDSLLTVLDSVLATMDTSTTEYKNAKFDYDFVVHDGSRGVHNHRYAKKLLRDALYDVTGLEEYRWHAAGAEKVNRYFLSQAYPNPFSAVSSVRYAVPDDARVTIRIYDVTGRLIKTLLDGDHGPGVYSAPWDASDDSGAEVGGGIYFLRLSAHGAERRAFRSTKKLVFVK